MLKKDKQIIEDFLSYMTHNLGRSENTIKSYRSDLKLIFSDIQDYSKLTKRDLITYFGKLSARNKPATINRKITATQELYKYLVTTEHMESSPANGIPRPTIGERDLNPPTRDEIATTIKSLQRNGHDMLALATAMGAYCGMRIGETLKVEVENIDWENGLITLGKVKNKDVRIVAVDDATLRQIKEYCNRHGVTKGRVLRGKNGKPVSENWLSKLVKKNCPTNFHMNRHFCGTEITSAKGIYAAKEQLGHRSIQTTQKYAHARRDVQRQVVNDVFGR